MVFSRKLKRGEAVINYIEKSVVDSRDDFVELVDDLYSKL